MHNWVPFEVSTQGGTPSLSSSCSVEHLSGRQRGFQRVPFPLRGIPEAAKNPCPDCRLFGESGLPDRDLTQLGRSTSIWKQELQALSW